MKNTIHQPTQHTPVQNEYDVVVCGGTPAGISAAVRAARGGLRVLLTQHTAHLGGMCINGLCQWDAKSDHRRSPIFGEILDRLETHYREAYGPESDAHKAAQYSVARYPVGCYEPSVIEGIFNALVAEQDAITVWLNVYPAAVETDGKAIRSASFRERGSEAIRTATARVFIDATYEGDLAAVAGVSYRAGREAAAEYGEPHAGLLFTRTRKGRAPSLAISGRLNMVTFGSQHGGHDPASPQTADHHIQAYNLRPCVSRDPANQILLERPPERYDRARYIHYRRGGLCIQADINNKNSYNSPILPGYNWDYPEGDWTVREHIDQLHRDFALGWMWFLQNDPDVPEQKRHAARTWGLPTDEYSDNGHLPYEMYVRETRRIVGRHVLTENDLLPREGFMRPRPFEDSIAFTDWYMDSHDCGRSIGTYGQDGIVGTPEYPFDGKLILSEECRPGMIPYRSLVARTIDNLIVPVCCSTTHITWGAIRLEPVFIHLGEVAGFAAVRSLATGEAVNALDTSALQRHLIEAGASIAFFNQHREMVDDPRRGELELAACHGEHDSYDREESAR